MKKKTTNDGRLPVNHLHFIALVNLFRYHFVTALERKQKYIHTNIAGKHQEKTHTDAKLCNS